MRAYVNKNACKKFLYFVLLNIIEACRTPTTRYKYDLTKTYKPTYKQITINKSCLWFFDAS